MARYRIATPRVKSVEKGCQCPLDEVRPLPGAGGFLTTRCVLKTDNQMLTWVRRPTSIVGGKALMTRTGLLRCRTKGPSRGIADGDSLIKP